MAVATPLVGFRVPVAMAGVAMTAVMVAMLELQTAWGGSESPIKAPMLVESCVFLDRSHQASTFLTREGKKQGRERESCGSGSLSLSRM